MDQPPGQSMLDLADIQCSASLNRNVQKLTV